MKKIVSELLDFLADIVEEFYWLIWVFGFIIVGWGVSRLFKSEHLFRAFFVSFAMIIFGVGFFKILRDRHQEKDTPTKDVIQQNRNIYMYLAIGLILAFILEVYLYFENRS